MVESGSTCKRAGSGLNEPRNSSFVLIPEVALCHQFRDRMPCTTSCGSLTYALLMLLATAAGSLRIQQHQQQQQHTLERTPYFRDLIEQVLFAPADVQQVFAHIPSMFASGTYLQVNLSGPQCTAEASSTLQYSSTS